jgi:hypothetical protein
MRRKLLPLLVAVLALAGCGSSSSGSSSPVNTELSYFPANAPFVMSIQTDPNSPAIKNAQSLLSRFPLASFGQSALTARLSQLGIDYQNQVRPLFGNPLMFGEVTTGTAAPSGASSFLAVWVTKDSSKLRGLIGKIQGLSRTGSHDGATLYSAGGAATVAVDGATVVIGGSSALTNAALDRHAHGGGISSSQYSHAFSGLPTGALVQAFGNLSGVLLQPSAAQARRVPWVAAVRGYATSISASGSGLTFKYRVDTSGKPLTAAQVPLTTTPGTPTLAGTLPISAGIQDPAHIFSFAEAAERTTSPAGYAKFLARQAAVRKKTGVDLNSLLRLATGSLIVSSDTHTTLARVGVSNPAAASRTLAKLLSQPRSVLDSATSATRLPGGFYVIHESRQAITVGVAHGQLLVGKASPGQLRAFASLPATPLPGAQGSVAFRIGLSQLLRVALKQAPPEVAQSILTSLGDITGWVSATPTALTGTASLAVR